MRQSALPLSATSVAAAATAACCLWWPATAAYTCASDTSLGSTALAAKKGIAVDDSTLKWCASQVPEVWPNSNAPMTSIRLFKAWDKTWVADREAAWNNLAAYVTSAGAKVLIGQQITCDEDEDNQAWEWTKALVQKLDPDHVMGLGIGNELELLQYKGADMVPDSCSQKIWEEGYLWRQFKRMVGDFDALGFGDVPVTSVFTGLGLAGSPFYENAGKARVNSFLVNATKEYGNRFAFTWNFYPYFDPNYGIDAGTSDQCTNALKHAACWGPDCSVPMQMRMARSKMGQLAEQANVAAGGKLWVGETGWSSQLAESLQTNMKPCPAWSSMDTFQNYYRDFLAWDLDIGGGVQAPDHVFWFTMRDSHNFGANEYFGLISACDEPACKVASEGYAAATYSQFDDPAARSCGDASLYNDWSRGETHCRNKCTLDPNCQYYGIWPHSHDGNYWCKLTASCNTWAAETLQVSTHQKGPASSPEPTPTPSPAEPAPTPTPSPAEPTPTPTPSPAEPTPTPTPSPAEPTPTPTPSPAEPTPTPSPAEPTPTPTPSPSEPAPMPAPAPTPSPSPPTPAGGGSGDGKPDGVKDPSPPSEKEEPAGRQDTPISTASRSSARMVSLLAAFIAAPLARSLL